MQNITSLLNEIKTGTKLKAISTAYFTLHDLCKNKETRPPVEHLLTELNTYYYARQLESYCFLIQLYLPSSELVEEANQDAYLIYINSCDENTRQKDKLFLQTLLKNETAKGRKLKDGSVNVILRTMVRNSGYLHSELFESYIEEFNRKYGNFAVELAVKYDDDQTNQKPEASLYRFLQSSCTLMGEEATVKLLNKLCFREDESYFDLEYLWLNYHRYFENIDKCSEGIVLHRIFKLIDKFKLDIPKRVNYTIFNYYDLGLKSK